ncbi:MAG: hypothetical protein LKE61_09185 [Erysipelotrichaceae bacterium]|jgi:hypothetical protein|nr:hypothetical protein [Erysipelotrichaceae bacterium]MCH4043972.1 hypothetical protein [Erysipelotrichaceae bacterium]MCH4121187.1 hypothetical protein [Erysipelotrichaceae bacterium]
MNEATLSSIKETIKDVALYIMPIAAFVLSIISLLQTRRISKLESKSREYDEYIKKAEVEKIRAEKEYKPAANIDARVYKISHNNYKINVFNKGDASAYNIDYEIENGSCVMPTKQVTPFEELEPGAHFEEGIIVVMSGSGPKYIITLTWKDSDGSPHSKKMVKSIE